MVVLPPHSYSCEAFHYRWKQTLVRETYPLLRLAAYWETSLFREGDKAVLRCEALFCAIDCGEEGSIRNRTTDWRDEHLSDTLTANSTEDHLRGSVARIGEGR